MNMFNYITWSVFHSNIHFYQTLCTMEEVSLKLYVQKNTHYENNNVHYYQYIVAYSLHFHDTIAYNDDAIPQTPAGGTTIIHPHQTVLKPLLCINCHMILSNNNYNLRRWENATKLANNLKMLSFRDQTKYHYWPPTYLLLNMEHFKYYYYWVVSQNTLPFRVTLAAVMLSDNEEGAESVCSNTFNTICITWHNKVPWPSLSNKLNWEGGGHWIGNYGNTTGHECQFNNKSYQSTFLIKKEFNAVMVFNFIQ